MSEVDPGRPYPGEVEFRYQRDSQYQFLVDYGLASSLEDAGFCWIACCEMVFSAYVPNELERLDMVEQFSLEAFKRGLLGDYFGTKGGLLPGRTPDLATILNSLVTRKSLPVKFNAIFDATPEAGTLQTLDGGGQVIAGTEFIGRKHMIIMHNLNHTGEKPIIEYYDPSIWNDLSANRFLTPEDIRRRIKFGAPLHLNELILATPTMP